MVTLSLEMGAEEMTYNVKMGLNSLRCALVNMGDNTWTLIAAAYHAAKQFGQEDKIKDYVDEYYPYVCTCTEDVQTIKESLQQAEDAGVSVNANKGMFTSCSEDAMGVPTKAWSGLMRKHLKGQDCEAYASRLNIFWIISHKKAYITI